MVKGVCKQVVLVRPKEEDSFEQAIFILKESGTEVSEQQLLRQARQAAQAPVRSSRFWRSLVFAAAFCFGALTVALAWVLCVFL